MSTCWSCGGVIGRDCFNPSECAWITQQQQQQLQQTLGELQQQLQSPFGMSLRDYFAGQALAAMLSIEDVHHNAGESEIAQWAYEQADAMLEARFINPQSAVEAQQIATGVPQ